MADIFPLGKSAALREKFRRDGRRVVLAAGAFDLLHPGHIRLLEQARGLGDLLVVAVEDDQAVRAAARASRAPSETLKKRPVHPQSERAEILAALAAVDCVIELSGIAGDEFAAFFRPDAYARGGMQQNRIRASEATRLVQIPLEPGYSTAALIDRIQQLPQ